MSFLRRWLLPCLPLSCSTTIASHAAGIGKDNLKGFLCFGSQGAPGCAQAVREKGLNDVVQVCGTTTPNQARQYLEDGSFDYSFIWSPADAAYSLVYVTKSMLEGKSLSDIKDIPNVGKPTLEGNTLKFNKPMGITKENSTD